MQPPPQRQVKAPQVTIQLQIETHRVSPSAKEGENLVLGSFPSTRQPLENQAVATLKMGSHFVVVQKPSVNAVHAGR
jgi:hypothetical protein